MMVPRAAALVLLLLALLTPLAAEAASPGAVPRIGVLRAGSPESDPYIEPFRQGLRELGYVEGTNVALEVRWARGQASRLPELAAELVRLPVDLLVVGGTQATRAAQRATRRIPIVMVAVGDPVTSGFVASRVRPGGNTTGLTLLHPEVAAKRLALLTEIAPAAIRVAVLRDPASMAPSNPVWRTTEVTMQALGLRMQPVDVGVPEALEPAMAAAMGSAERPEALVVLPDPMFTEQRDRIVALAASHHLPAVYESRDFVEAGGLLSYGPSLVQQFRRAATYVDAILRGAAPADLALEEPSRFELAVNLRTARALGVRIPAALLARADEVIR